MIALGVLLTVINLLRSTKKGAIAGPDPWKANTLEWFTPSPPPENNFDVVPRVRSVEPMKDIRRQIEQQTGVPAAVPVRRAAAAAMSRLRRPHRHPLAVGGVRQVVADYVTLTKPRVQLLLLLTTVTTMYVAGDPSVGLVALTCLGGSLSAGGAGAVNHYYDRDIDAQMARTATRPVPSGRVRPGAALAYGFVLQALSFVLLATTVNLLAAVPGALPGSSATCSSTRCGSSARRRRTSSSAAPPAPSRRSSAGPRSPATWTRPPGTCSRSSSTGRRRTSGRCRC